MGDNTRPKEGPDASSTLPAVLLAESDEKTAQILKVVLRDAGFNHIHHADSIEQVRSILATDPIDLFLADAKLKDGTASVLIRQIRENALGADPFVPIIAMISSPDPDLIRGLIDDGPDDLILKPFTAKALSERIGRIIEDRKPFVVTRDYVGPDRRSKPRADSASAPTFVVPNALARKTKGSPSEEVFDFAIKKTITDIKEAHIEAQAGGILYQLDRVLPKLAEGKLGKAEQGALDEIIAFSTQIRDGAGKTRHAGEIITFNAILSLAEALRSGEKAGLAQNIAQMQTLAEGIRKNFDL